MYIKKYHKEVNFQVMVELLILNLNFHVGRLHMDEEEVNYFMIQKDCILIYIPFHLKLQSQNAQ